MTIEKGIEYIGVTDREIKLFEGLFPVRHGVTYNSYLVKDEKTAVMDSVDERFVGEWLENLKRALGGASPDYLVVQHMEPDHSAGILRFHEAYPSAKIVASSRAFVIMKQLFGREFADCKQVVKEGDVLPLGKKKLVFIEAPLVHWPEVIVSYEESTGTLFSADAFGRFGGRENDGEWAEEARRYYFGIVGKFGRQVRVLLQKLSNFGIRKICPLHGPVLRENLGEYLELYWKWSGYLAEERGTLIVYASVYGNTARAAKAMEEELSLRGEKTARRDLGTDEFFEAVANAFRYDKLVVASTTYNGGVFPTVKAYLDALLVRGFKNRKVGFIENGSWSPTAAGGMREILSSAEGLSFVGTATVRTALNETSREEIAALARALTEESHNH